MWASICSRSTVWILDIGGDLQQLNDAQKALKSGGSLLVGTAFTAVGAVAGNACVVRDCPHIRFKGEPVEWDGVDVLAIKQSVRATENLAYVPD